MNIEYKVKINGEPLATIEASKQSAQPKLTHIVPYNPVFLEKVDLKEAAEKMTSQIEGEYSENTEIDFDDSRIFEN